jgi:hypothetical protein
MPKMTVLHELGPDRQPTGRDSYWLWCPACDDAVRIDSSWGWNGDLERPTFTPSLLTRMTIAGVENVCHSFVTDGVWNFLGDCTHDKAGQFVPMVDLPAWLAKESA